MFPTKVALFALFSLFLAGKKRRRCWCTAQSVHRMEEGEGGGAFVTQSRESRGGFCRDFFLLFPLLVTTKSGALLTLVRTHNHLNVHHCVHVSHKENYYHYYKTLLKAFSRRIQYKMYHIFLFTKTRSLAVRSFKNTVGRQSTNSLTRDKILSTHRSISLFHHLPQQALNNCGHLADPFLPPNPSSKTRRKEKGR